MGRSTIAMMLVILTILSFQVMTGPWNFLWLMMLVVDFWAIVLYIGYEMVIGLIKAAKK